MEATEYGGMTLFIFDLMMLDVRALGMIRLTCWRDVYPFECKAKSNILIPSKPRTDWSTPLVTKKVCFLEVPPTLS